VLLDSHRRKYMCKITRLLVIIFCLAPSLVSASEVVLKSGQKLEGKIVAQTVKYIKLDSGIGVVMTYYSDEINTLDGNKLQLLTHSGLQPVSAGTDSCKVDSFSILLTDKSNFAVAIEPVAQCQSIMSESGVASPEQGCYAFYQNLGQRCCQLVQNISTRDKRIDSYQIAMMATRKGAEGALLPMSEDSLCGYVSWNADGIPKFITPAQREAEQARSLDKVILKIRTDLGTLQRAVEAYKSKTNKIPFYDVPISNPESYSLASTYLVPQFLPSPLYDPFNTTPNTEYIYSHIDANHYAICSKGLKGNGNAGWAGSQCNPDHGAICITNGTCDGLGAGTCVDDVLTPPYSAVQAAKSAQQSHNIDPEYNGLFDCTKKMYPESMSPFFSNHEYSLVVLDADLIYILDEKNGEFYILTPFFTGKTDLTYDKNGSGIEESSTHSYNIRIPYLPPDVSKQRGYYYLTINRSYGGHDLNINFPARFIPGDPQTIPDFKKARSGSITITSINGVSTFDNVEEYHSLAFEDEIWRTVTNNIQNQPNVILPDIKALLISDIDSRTGTMGPKMKAGERSGCWGHAGCDYTTTQEEADAYNKKRQEAIDTCQAVADKYQVELFPPGNTLDESSETTEKVKLAMTTVPSGAECRCEATKFWGQETRQSYLDNIFLVDKTPGTLELPKGEYKKVLCRCVLQNDQNYCQNTVFQFSGDLGGKIDHDMSQEKNFADSESGLGTGDCRHVDVQYCKTNSDCFNNGYGACYRNDMVWMWSGKSGDYTPAQRANIGGCECVKHQCELSPHIDQNTMDHARILGLPQSTRKQGAYAHVLKVWNDGTAYIEGLVTDFQGSGCFPLGSVSQCYLKLKVDNAQVFLMFNKSNGIMNKDYLTSDPKDFSLIRMNDAVQAYGKHVHGAIFADGSTDYFIKFADEETPQIVKERLNQKDK